MTYVYLPKAYEEASFWNKELWTFCYTSKFKKQSCRTEYDLDWLIDTPSFLTVINQKLYQR
jgi:hypothetical protein